MKTHFEHFPSKVLQKCDNHSNRFIQQYQDIITISVFSNKMVPRMLL